MWVLRRILWSVLLALTAWPHLPQALAAATPPKAANRLTYLDVDDPFYPGLSFPKLTTPQWIGEPGVEAAVILAIDDMREPDKYETVLRPILERLKRIDGRAPVSIMCTAIDPSHAQLRKWLEEGLSLEVHTLKHPCPFLANSNFLAAVETYQGCIEQLKRVPGNRPVAFRMPCCDSINSPSPRFYAGLFNQSSAAGSFLTIDSSVMNILTPNDSALPREWVTDPNGEAKFRKYLPFPSFVTTIEDYPYPYVIDKLCWEFPPMVPSDWEAQHVHGTNNPVTVADWKAALDAAVLKQGTFTFIFHPHGWIRPDQLVDFIDYAVQRHGKKVKFLTFREAEERLNHHLLAGQPLRAENGQDNGVRLLDLNNDGYLDVVIGNDQARKTRLWQPTQRTWKEMDFPTRLVRSDQDGSRVDAGVRFGVVEPDGYASMLVNAGTKGAWHFDGQQWVETKALWLGLELDGKPILTSDGDRDRGVRLRDLNQDGRCELLVGNETQNAIFSWSPEEETWKKLAFGLPSGTALVDDRGRDNGLRFVDVNEDGYEDVVFSNPRRYSLHLFVAKAFLGFQEGWSREVLAGRRGEPGEIPMIVRDGPVPNNGAWFHSRHLWVQNEETSSLPDYVDRRSYEQLLGGLQPKAKSPEESLGCLRPRPGFKVELVACEPLVKDPIAFEWGPDGKLWVVEMGDYPLGTDGHGKPGGVVRFLEDTDGDGRYDRSTVFLDGIGFPTGVMPWGKGVLISAAPEIFYAEDSDGDGRADIRVPLFRGFGEGNQQHRVNGFEYGLDNWVYGANGDSGGQVHWVGTLAAPSAAPPGLDRVFELRGHDFRFRPEAGLFETVSGQTQYGRHRDDWGNWFGNNNPTWLWHVFLPEQYLTRNPYLPVKTVKEYLANYSESTRVYPISRTMQRFNDVGALNHVTSANSATPYRDDVFGPEFETSVFVSEPVHNAVHREVLEPEGVSFRSHRAADEQDREFLASSDNWFRPTMLKTGPDGALYVADMYRLVIEHPEWIPADSQKSLDLRAGHDQGRIYRVFPENARLRPVPRLAALTPAQLVEVMDSPNGWTRDTAQKLLIQMTAKSVSGRLAAVAGQSPNPKARLQALCTLAGLGQLAPAMLLRAFDDPHPAVREHAVRLSEPFLKDSKKAGSGNGGQDERARLGHRLLAMVNDPAVRVQYQLAFTLGEWNDPAAADGLLRLGLQDANVPAVQTAVLSSAVPHVDHMLSVLGREHRPEPGSTLFEELLALAVALKHNDALVQSLDSITQREAAQYAAWQFAAAARLLEAVEHDYGSLLQFQKQAGGALRSRLERLSGLLGQAHTVALNSHASAAEREAAIRLIGYGFNEQQRNLSTLTQLLRPQTPSPLQKAVLNRLSRWRGPEIAELLLDQWNEYEPETRVEALNLLLSRSEWTERLLGALEGRSIPVAQISASQRQRLLSSNQPSNRERARKVFAATAGQREVMKSSRQVLELTGDPGRGGNLFRQNCVTCHHFHGEGANVGPDLGALGSKSRQTLLTAILDPNQAVETRYLNYNATTSSGREISGIIAAETPNSVTFRSAGGVEETVLRSDLKDLSSSGLSLMPEGFDRLMNAQELADLIAYLTAAQ